MNKLNDIFLKEKTVSEKGLKGYRIYSDEKNFTHIEAATAAEAMEKSQVKNPYKIVPAYVVTKSIFSQAELAELNNAIMATSLQA